METQEQLIQRIWSALAMVDDPDLKKDLVSLGMIKDLRLEGRKLSFKVELTTPACPMKDMIHNACINAIKHLVDSSLELEVEMTSRVSSLRGNPDVLPGVKNIIAVGSGKGGVGKSTITVNLAFELARSGAKVGILDADIYGPSVPMMLGLQGRQLEMQGSVMIPQEAFGIKVMSIGFLVDPDQPVVWRGPMVSSAIKQFIRDVSWGELDYLLVDMPPGTGDVHITIAQNIPLTGAILVSTPQQVAVADCRKALAMFQIEGVKVQVLGLVENMAWFSPMDAPDKKYFIFGEGGVDALAEHSGVPVLGRIPLETGFREKGDDGLGAWEWEHGLSKSFFELAAETARRVSIANQALVELSQN